ncbi:MAG: putative ral secretory pathway transrane protein [Polaromonas sp.]|nr:putative ral secretory pathway transrane protein [Polaromonas sp.]
MHYNPSAATVSASAPWRWALTGALVGLALALAWFAPARWLATLVRQGTGEHVALDAPRGTFWQGSAQLVLSGGTGSRDAMALPGQLVWRIRPAWNGLNVQLSAECCTSQALLMTVTPAWSGLRLAVADAQSHWPASLLAGLGTPWNTLQAQGRLQASTQGFSAQWLQGRLSVAGRVQLDAIAISSRLSTLRPMGSYRLILRGGASPTLELATLEGNLQLSGRGHWAGQRLHFDGTAKAAPESVDALSNLLNIIGRRNGATAIIKVG